MMIRHEWLGTVALGVAAGVMTDGFLPGVVASVLLVLGVRWSKP